VRKEGGVKGFSLYKIMNFIRQGVDPTPLGKTPWEGSGKKGGFYTPTPLGAFEEFSVDYC
jgi:hypothetical protein